MGKKVAVSTKALRRTFKMPLFGETMKKLARDAARTSPGSRIAPAKVEAKDRALGYRFDRGVDIPGTNQFIVKVQPNKDADIASFKKVANQDSDGYFAELVLTKGDEISQEDIEAMLLEQGPRTE